MTHNKKSGNNASKFLSILTIICLNGFLLVLPGCGKNGDKPEVKPEKTESTAQTEQKPVTETETPASEAVPHFIHSSDIHFNPFYDTSLVAQLVKAPANQWESIFQTSTIKDYSKINESDTNYPLFASALDHMVKFSTRPDFMIITGDLLVHEFSDKFSASAPSGSNLDAFITKTMEFISSMMRNAFKKTAPNMPIYFTLGNNDCYSGDYKIKANGAFLKNTEPVFSKNFLVDPANKASFKSTWPIGGYYTVTPPGLPNTRIIAVNSVFFTYDSRRPAPQPGNAAFEELKWLEGELKKARHDKAKVWLFMHIPPGVNAYSTYNKKTFTPMWHNAYLAPYIQMIETYHPEITASMGGHTHMDDWRVYFRFDR